MRASEESYVPEPYLQGGLFWRMEVWRGRKTDVLTMLIMLWTFCCPIGGTSSTRGLLL
jgi:hypothetical protein